MKKAILILLTLCGAIPVLCQTPLAPPLPQGSTYYKGLVASQTGIGVIGCTNEEFILADGSGCGDGANGPGSFAVDITQAPYNAKCDGTTDDHVAIQSALDHNASIMIPIGPNAPTECMLGTVGITLCSSNNLFGYNAIYGNGQIFGYSGSGIAITISSDCNTILPNIAYSRIQDLNIDAGTATGRPTMIEGQDAGLTVIDNVNDALYTTLTPGSYNSIIFGNDIGTETGTISNYAGNGTLIIIGGSSETCCMTISSSAFDSLTSINTSDITLSAVSFASTTTTSTINDANVFAIIGGDFAGPLQIGTPDGGVSTVSINGVGFGVPMIASGTAIIEGTGNYFFSNTLPVVTGTYSGQISGVIDYSNSNTHFDEYNGLEINPGLLAGTYTDTEWCSYTSSGKLINCNNPVPQVNLSLIKGTYTNGDLCSYTTTGTLLNCNTPNNSSTSTATLGSCGTGTPSLSGTSRGFKITGIASGTTACTVTFSPSLSVGGCTISSNSPGILGAYVETTGVSSVLFGASSGSPTFTEIDSICF